MSFELIKQNQTFMDCRDFTWLMNWRAPENRLDEFWAATQIAMKK